MPYEARPARPLGVDDPLAFGRLLALESGCARRWGIREANGPSAADEHSGLLGDAKHRGAAAILSQSGASTFAAAVAAAGGMASVTRAALLGALERVARARGGGAALRDDLLRVRGTLWAAEVRDESRALAWHAWGLTRGRATAGVGSLHCEAELEVSLGDGRWRARPDLVWEADGRVEITDFKTAAADEDPGNAEQQLMIYAALWRRARGGDDYTVRVVRPTGVAWERRVGGEQLDRFAARLGERGRAARRAGQALLPSPGRDRCLACPVRGACEAYWSDPTLRAGASVSVDRELLIEGDWDPGARTVAVTADGAPATLKVPTSSELAVEGLRRGARARWVGLFEASESAWSAGRPGLVATVPTAHTALRGAEAWTVSGG